MGFNWAEAKSTVRRIVHDTMAVPAFLEFTPNGSGVDITARYHSGIVKQGLVEGEGAERYADVTQVVFDRQTLLEKGIELQRGYIVDFTDYGVRVVLDAMLPHDGPVEEKWLVTQE